MYIIMLDNLLPVFVITLGEEWKKQLGNYMIDYDTLTIVKVIAKGVRTKIAFQYS